MCSVRELKEFLEMFPEDAVVEVMKEVYSVSSGWVTEIAPIDLGESWYNSDLNILELES